MKTLEEVIDGLHRYKLTVVSRETGIPYMQVYKLYSGLYDRVPYTFVKQLSDWLDSK